jgi:hypothetical protein
MNFQILSEADKAIVGQALRAAADGPFFPDWEFHTLFGLQRTEVRAIADAWPEYSVTPEKLAQAVNNALNNLLGYPHGERAAWSKWISVDPQQLNELFCRLRERNDEDYFARME